jgi:hypothetical protein
MRLGIQSSGGLLGSCLGGLAFPHEVSGGIRSAKSGLGGLAACIGKSCLGV